jgi:hypothetical protein
VEIIKLGLDKKIKMSNIVNLYNLFKTKELFTWLNGRSFSDAFVICIGAGPWRLERRKKIQQLALDKLAGRDILHIEDNINWYPLNWQNKFVNNLNNYLKKTGLSMDLFCDIIQAENYNQLLYSACGCPNGSKVLSLFCRDGLKISNCFPIDRHVKRFLKENDLPTKESAMIELCLHANIDSARFATAIVRNYGNVDNPDWSIK